MNLKILIIGLLGTCNISFGGEALSLGIGIIDPSLRIDLQAEKDKDSKKLEFHPNKANHTALISQYGQLGLSLKTRNKLSEDNKKIPLNSNTEDYQIRFFGKRSNFEISYQSYKGYYIKNYSAFDNSLNNSSSEILFPNLETKNYSLNYIYNLKPEKFNINAAFGISEDQTYSGGSWLLGLFTSHQTLRSDKALTPSFTGSNFSEFLNLKATTQTNLGMSGGYGYYYTKKKLYASFLLMLSLAYQKQSLDFDTSKKDQEVSTIKSTVNLGFGYNSKKHKVAFNVLSNTIRTSVGSGALNSSSIDLGILYVYRWSDISIPYLESASKWVKKNTFGGH